MNQPSRPLSPDAFKSFGELLSFLRKRAHISQRELAVSVGYHYSHISRLEKGQHLPDPSTVRALFIPALGLQHDVVWANRLLDLAQASTSGNRPARTIVSHGNVQGLPTQLTSILGREEEIATLRKLLSNPNVRLLTLVGPPGVGKTRLAISIAEEISTQFADGVAFVDLTATRHASDVLPQFASSMGIEEVVEQTVNRTLIHLLQAKNLLIVMDNFEQVADAAPQLLPILARAPHIKMVVTSREALRIDGEFEFAVRPLPLPTQSIKSHASIQIFVERARAIQPDFELTGGNETLIAEICRRLDGLPLAIELAAARINTLSPAAMLEQFDRRFDWLTRGRSDSPTWRKTLSGAIDWSYQLLSEPERILMTRLSVFDGSWTLEAAEHVCSDDVLCPQSEILQLLLSLTDRSLVISEISDDQTRYRFLLTIHHYAIKHFARVEEQSSIRDKHLAFFSTWSEQTAARLEQIAPRQLRQLMERDFANLRSAFEWAQGNPALIEQGLRLVIAVGTIWLKLSHFKQALDWVNAFLPLSLNATHQMQHAKLLYLKSALTYWRDDLPSALRSNLEAETLARTLDNRKLLADILYYQGGCIYRELQRHEEAFVSLVECIEICRAEHHSSRLSIALTSLSLVLLYLGKQSESSAAIQEAIQITRARQDAWGQSYALRIHADLMRHEGRYPESLAGLRQALQTSLSIEDRISAGMALSNMALVCNLLEDHPASREYARSAFEIFNEIGNEYQQPFPLRMMGYAALAADEFEQARELGRTSLVGNREIGHQTGIVACMLLLAEIDLACGDAKRSAEILSAAMKRIDEKNLSLMEPDQQALERLLIAHAGQGVFHSLQNARTIEELCDDIGL